MTWKQTPEIPKPGADFVFRSVFTGIVTAVAAFSIWGQDMFPKEADPTGGMFCQDIVMGCQLTKCFI